MPSTNVLTIGLASIEIGDIAADGGMGTTLEPWGLTEEDSCTFTIEAPTVTDFRAEEVDDVIKSSLANGNKTLAFTIMDPGTDTMQKLFGGTVDVVGTAPNQTKTFNAPASTVTVERSLKVVTKEGMQLEITRAQITATTDTIIGRNALFTVNVSAKVLNPTKEDESPWRMIHITGTGGA